MLLPEDVLVLHYVDDVLVAAASREDCLTATKTLLHRLAECGYKVKQSKIQLFQPTVTFLGRTISAQGTGLAEPQKQAIRGFPRPTTVREMHTFLRLCNYSRGYVPDYVNLTKHLREMMAKEGHRSMSAQLHWTPEANDAFEDLKKAMDAAASLATPDYTLCFHLDVMEKGGVVNTILYQKPNGERKVLKYHSAKLDTVSQGHTGCIKHLLAIHNAIKKTEHLVQCHPLVVHTSHGVVAFMESTNFALTNKKYDQVVSTLKQSNITFSSQGVNMTTNLPHMQDIHDCETRHRGENKLRDALHATLLQEAQHTYFTDGCCYRTARGENIASYAVVE